MKESDCKVTDCGSRVQRVLIQSVDKMEKDTITLNEEKSDNAYGDEDHDVGFPRIRTTPRFTDETSVTSCGWRLMCGPSLPRTRCQ